MIILDNFMYSDIIKNMNNKFQVGDWVRCVNNCDVENYVIEGEVYKVVEAIHRSISILCPSHDNRLISFYANRFLLDEDPAIKILNSLPSSVTEIKIGSSMYKLETKTEWVLKMESKRKPNGF